MFLRGLTKIPDRSHSSFPNNLFIAVCVILFFAGTAISSNGLQDHIDANIEFCSEIIEQNTTDPDPTVQRLIELAKTDHVELLKWSMSIYRQNIKDYTVTLHKQERIDGELKKPQDISIWFKERPYSVLMKWDKNPLSVDKLLYVENSKNNKMIVHPTGVFSWIRSVKRNPRCEEVKKSSLRACDEFGFYRTMESLLEIYETAIENDNLEISYLGRGKVFSRDCVTMEAVLPESKDYPCKRLIMQFDTQYILPIGLVLYDCNDNLVSKYFFSKIQLNPGIEEETFSRKKNKL